MDYTMETLISFLQERWLVVLLAVIALIIIIKVVQTVFKWLVVALIVIGLIFYGAHYSEQLQDMSDKIKDYTLSEINELIERETESANYEEKANGTYVIQSKNMTLEGTNGSDQVKVIIKGKGITLTKNEMIETYIEQAKLKSK